MTKLARLVLMLLLVASWAVAQSAPADDKGKADSSAAAEHKHGEQAAMSCACCKDMAKKDGMKADNKDAAKSEAKSEGMTAGGGMGCCAKMGKDGAGGMSCGSKKDDAAKTETLPAEKMK